MFLIKIMKIWVFVIFWQLGRSWGRPAPRAFSANTCDKTHCVSLWKLLVWSSAKSHNFPAPSAPLKYCPRLPLNYSFLGCYLPDTTARKTRNSFLPELPYVLQQHVGAAPRNGSQLSSFLLCAWPHCHNLLSGGGRKFWNEFFVFLTKSYIS